jgi:hypothetical protein
MLGTALYRLEMVVHDEVQVVRGLSWKQIRGAGLHFNSQREMFL